MTESARPHTESYHYVWASAGSKAHLVPDVRLSSANPYALCRARVRLPRRTWTQLCPNCLRESAKVSHENPVERRT